MTKSEKLRYFLSEIGTDLKTVCRESGYAYSTYSKQASGQTRISESLIDLLVTRYHLNPEWWFFGAGAPVRQDINCASKMLQDLITVAEALNTAHGYQDIPIGNHLLFLRKTIVAYQWVTEYNKSVSVESMEEFLQVS